MPGRAGEVKGEMTMKIDVTSIDTIKLVKAAYALSVPRGMGMLHFKPGELSDEDAKQCIEPDGSVHMDYVRGRGCKFHVWVEEGKKFIVSPWYDHTDSDLQKLLATCGVSQEVEQEKHGYSCACPECDAHRNGRMKGGDARERTANTAHRQ
jgi:hypothetical protein